MLGANPAVSNGSLCTAPGFPGRLAAIRARGGKVVVVDPRRTRARRLEVQVEVSEEVMAGVVCLPHGWGHGQAGTRMSVAAEHPGVNTNVLTDASHIDPLSGKPGR